MCHCVGLLLVDVEQALESLQECEGRDKADVELQLFEDVALELLDCLLLYRYLVFLFNEDFKVLYTWALRLFDFCRD